MIDLPTLISYANRMEDKSLGSRLGYLLKLLGQPTEGIQCSESPVRLDPTRPPQGSARNRWRIIPNVPETELFPTGVA
mgnify:FL=1